MKEAPNLVACECKHWDIDHDSDGRCRNRQCKCTQFKKHKVRTVDLIERLIIAREDVIKGGSPKMVTEARAYFETVKNDLEASLNEKKG